VDAHFRDAFPYGSDVSRVAQAQAINSAQDLGLAHVIPQIGEPFVEFGRPLGRYHVAYKLHSDRGDFKAAGGNYLGRGSLFSYRAAVARWPRARITLRQGARVVMKTWTE